MNLIKCFKKKYAIQNIKKSKGILAILLLVVPIITLFSVYVQDQSIYSEPYHIFVAGGANFFGMFVIPFLLSNVLFGYIFKRKNIDFIHSLPINRKSIFITNTIVGFLYILALQLLNFLVTSIYILIVGNSLISIKLMFDIGLVMSLIYMFLFTVSSFAISLSGNIFTQIVVAVLLLFTLPFIRMTNFETILDGSEQVFVVNYNGVAIDYEIDNNPLFAMPLTTFVDFIDESRVLEVKSTILTIGLTAFYILAGINVFEKRKMENTGNSFESETVHLIVKGITLYPAIVVLKEYLDEIELPYLLLSIFLMFVYYFIYDLITSKKIKLRKTIISYVITIVGLTIITTGLSSIGDKLKEDRDYYYADEMVGMEVRLSELYYGDNWFGRIEEESLRRAIMEEVLNSKDNNYYDTKYSYSSGYYTNSYDISYVKDMTRSLELKCKFKDGREIEIYGNISNDLYKRVLEYIINNETYINDLVEKFKISKNSMINISDANIELTFICNKYKNLVDDINNNLKELILNKLKKDLKNIDNQSYNDNRNYNLLSSIYIYEYDNFERNAYSLLFDYNTQIAEMIFKEINKKALEITEERIKEIEKLEQENRYEYYYNLSGRIVYCEVNGDSTQSEYIDNLNLRELKKYLEEFNPEKIDITKPFVQISLFDLDSAIFINDLEDFKSKVSYTSRKEIDNDNYYYTDDTIFEGEVYTTIVEDAVPETDSI